MARLSASVLMNCPYCGGAAVKNGTNRLKDNTVIQGYRCKACGKRFNERTGTPMARLRTPTSMVAIAQKKRTEGTGIRATGRILEKSHSTIIRWKQRVADKATAWSPPAPPDTEVTIVGDELYTRVRENLPPRASQKVGQLVMHELDVPVLVGCLCGVEKYQAV